VVVVLDCVRASSFPGTGGAPGSFPVLEALRSECTVFTAATTVAPWTLPSHASLFTGRYPWEHGVLGEGRLQYEESLPTMAGALREAGYGTLGLSANGLLYPLFAAPGSYAQFRCAEWWEKTFRWVRPESLDHATATRPRGGRNGLAILARGIRSRSTRTPPLEFVRGEEAGASIPEAVQSARPEERPLGRTAEMLSWGAIDASNRTARVLRTPGDPHPLPVAPWIEPTLSSWLATQPADRPVHCFVNFLDAHEKYLSDGALVRGLPAWWRFLQISQNSRRWLEGDWSPTAEELLLLRRHYEATLLQLSRRVENLIRAFQAAGRWKNTLLIVTSDHGQAFGEHGELFHERSPVEPLLHVPLWVRWPSGTGQPGVRTDRVSLIDVAATVLEAARVESPFSSSGSPLQFAPAGLREPPVLAMADGYPTLEIYRKRLDEGLLQRLQRSYGVAYHGTTKAIARVQDGTVQTFHLGRNAAEAPESGTDPDAESARAVEAARGVADELRRASEGTVDTSVEARLQSWGYL
jgi:arylsulfatase A-like enzyme